MVRCIATRDLFMLCNFLPLITLVFMAYVRAKVCLTDPWPDLGLRPHAQKFV